MELADLIKQRQSQDVAIRSEESKLVAEESEVRAAVGQTKADLRTQRAAAANYNTVLDEQDLQNREALAALINQETAQADLDNSAFQAREKKLQERDKVAAQLKAQFVPDALLSTIGQNVQVMQKEVDVYTDKLSAARQEIVETSNPIKWAWKNLVEVPYFEKKVQQSQQQVLNTLGVAGKTFLTANNAQVLADNFTTQATDETVVANVYNLRAAQLAANKEQLEAGASQERTKIFGAKYGIAKDITDQMQQLTGIIASTYNANKSNSLRASGAKGTEDILDIYRKWGELAETLKASPGQIETFKQNGVDFDSAMSLGSVARGMYLNHVASDLPLVQSGSFAKEEEIPLLLQNGRKAASILPSPMNSFITNAILQDAEKEYVTLKNVMSAGGDSATFLESSKYIRGERDTLVKGSVKKINGMDLTGAFSVPMVWDQKTRGGTPLGINDGVPRTPGQFLAETALLAPGTPIGKELLSSQEIERLIASGRPGAKLAQQYRAFADGKTAEGNPVISANHVLSFDEIRAMANNDAAEIYGFYNATYKLANLSLPYTALGAKPTPFEAKIPGSFVTNGTFGPDSKSWAAAPRSVDDVKKWMMQADASKQLAIAQQKDRLALQQLGAAVGKLNPVNVLREQYEKDKQRSAELDKGK